MKRLVIPSATRQPRPHVLLSQADPAVVPAGTPKYDPAEPLPGVISASVTSNAHYQADSFRLEIALNAPGGHDLDWWGADERKGMLFDIRIAISASETVKMILGEAKEIDINVPMGTVTLSGNDLTQRLIDARIQEAFQNKRSSEIATILATRRGLIPVVTNTDFAAYRYFADIHERTQHDSFSRAGTEWDLLTFLAQREGFDVFVTGRDLHFQPETDPKTLEPFLVRWDATAEKSDVQNLQLRRSLTLAKDVVVMIRSWETQKGKGFTASSPPSAARAQVQAGTAQRYIFTRPNLTHDQAQKEANRLREDITRHERNISFSVPGELALTARDVIALRGCGSWDQLYFVNTVNRTVSFDGGFVQTVTAKNHFTESQASV